jgi:RNA polymerase sigma-70 factor (ECF subfamily)
LGPDHPEKKKSMTGANVNQGEGVPSTSLTLLDRVKARDQAAWERMVSLYSPLIYHWCRQAGLQAADAADVGQEVFQAVARKVADFRHDREGDTFRGWLRTITRNKICDHARNAQSGGVGAGGSDALAALAQVAADASSASGDAADESDAALVYRRALDLVRSEFEAPTWDAFWRVTIDNQCPEDVARKLGMTLNAVYLAKSRILRRLREEFTELVDSNFLDQASGT